MSFPLWDLASDLAVARGGGKIKTDPTELVEAPTLRRRIAALAWIPSAAGMLALGGLTGSWVVGVAGLVVLIAGLWLFAERGDCIYAWIRRRKESAA